MFTQTELNILKNFASINPSQIIHPDGFKAIKNSKSVVAYYNFDHKPYDYETFGIYDLSEFLSIVNALHVEDCNMVVGAKNVTIQANDGDQIKYFTTPLDILPVVPDVEMKFKSLDCELDFDLSSDRLAMIFKMANVLKAGFLFIESAEKKIRLTIADQLESSNNSYEVSVEVGIRSNKLAQDQALKIPLTDLNLLQGDYAVKISTKKISRWENLNGATYFIGCSVI